MIKYKNWLMGKKSNSEEPPRGKENAHSDQSSNSQSPTKTLASTLPLCNKETH
jgi:hypothetical protein